MSKQLIVVGNIFDDKNEFCSNGRVYDGGGIAPTIGSSNFGHERYVLEKKPTETTNDKNQTSNQNRIY